MKTFINLNDLYTVMNREIEAYENMQGHFDIIKVEDLSLPNGKPASYNRRSYYKISLVSGHSKIHYADKVYEISGTTLLFTNPMIPYRWERLSEEQSGYICLFTENFFTAFGTISEYPVFKFPKNAIIALDNISAEYYQKIFVRMINELDGDYRYRFDLLRNITMEIIHETQKLQPYLEGTTSVSNSLERITVEFKELLERQFPIVVSSQQVKYDSPKKFAEKLNVHVNHLNKALKTVTGKTTSELINNRLTVEAMILLKNTSWTISEIAVCMGFEEPQHFSSFFKRITDSSPKDFRKRGMD